MNEKRAKKQGAKRQAAERMKELKSITVKPGESIRISLHGKVDVELRITRLGQPEIFCDHTQIVRRFRDYYMPNETC